MSTIPEVVPSIWEWVWRTSLHVCVIVCVIRIVQLSLRRVLTPRWQYALWMLVLIRMVMPIGLETPWSVYNLFHTEPAPETVNLQPLPAYDWVFESMTLPVFVTPTPITTVQPDQSLDWSSGLALVWIAGMVALSIHLLLQWRRLNRIVANGCVHESEPLGALMNTCVRALGLRRTPKVVECDIAVPGLYGFLRPMLLLPKGLANALDANELRFILLHELSHAKRRDLPVNWLMTLMQVIHWFNPLVWYAFMRMRTDRELACDALALSHAGPEESKAYGNTLLKLMDANHGLRPTPGMIGILENHAHLKRRIIAIAQFTTRSYKWSIPALVVLTLVAATTLTQAMQEEGVRDSDDETSVATTAPVETDVRLIEMVIPEVESELAADTSNDTNAQEILEDSNTNEEAALELESIRTLLKEERHIDARVGQQDTEPVPVVRVESVLEPMPDVVAEPVVESDPEAVVEPVPEPGPKVKIAQENDKHEGEAQSDDSGLRLQHMLGSPERFVYLADPRLPDEHPLMQKVNVDFREMDLTEVLSLLTGKADLNVLTEEEITGTVTADWKDMPLGEAIERALHDNGYGIVEESGVYRVTHYDDARRIQVLQERGLHLRSNALVHDDVLAGEDPLRQPVNVDFKELQLRSVVELLTEKGDISYTVSDDASLDGTVTANLKDIPLGRAIEIILRMNDLGIIKDGDAWLIDDYENVARKYRQRAEREGIATIVQTFPDLVIRQVGKMTMDSKTQRVSGMYDGVDIKLEKGWRVTSNRVNFDHDAEVMTFHDGVSVFEPMEGLEILRADSMTRRADGMCVLEWNVRITLPGKPTTVANKAEFSPATGEVTVMEVSAAQEPQVEPTPQAAEEPGLETAEEPEDVQNVEVGGGLRIRETRVTSPADPLEEKLEEEVSITGESMHVIPFFRAMGKQQGITVEFDLDVIAPPDAEDTDRYVTDGVIEYVKLERVTLRQAIDAMLRPLNLAPIILHDRVLVTSAARAEQYQDGMTFADAPSGLQPTMPELDEPVDFVFTGTDAHLSRLLNLLIERSGINFVVDNRYVAPAPGDNAPTPDTVYTDGILKGETRFGNVSPRTVLQMTLPKLGLVYTVQKGFVWITSPESARHESFEDLETRYYALDDDVVKRIAPEGNEDSLIETLGLFAPPILELNTGKELSFIRYNAETRQLVVHQTPLNHWRIEQWLLKLRGFVPPDTVPLATKAKEPSDDREGEPKSGSDVEPPKEPARDVAVEPLILELDGWNVIRVSARDAYVGDLLERVAAERGYELKIENGIVAPKDARSSEGYHTDGRFFAEQRGGVVSDVLENVFKQLDLACLIHKDEMLVTTTLRAAGIFHQLSMEVHDTGAVRLYTWRVIDKMFYSGPGAYLKEGTHVQDFLEDLARRNSVVNYLIDPRAVLPPDGKTPEWIEETPVTDGIIRMSKRYRSNKTSRRAMLEDILPTLGLTWSVHHDFIWITTPELLAGEPEEDVIVRSYDVSAIRDGDWYPNFGKLGVDYQSRMNTLMPAVFNEDGQAKTFQLYRGGKFRDLLVVQTPSNHARLQAWLLRQGLDAGPRDPETGNPAA